MQLDTELFKKTKAPILQPSLLLKVAFLPIYQWFSIVALIKIVLMVVFSSDYEDRLFIPFVRHFLNSFDNPWDYFRAHSLKGDEFPYQPLMLYIVALFCAPLKFIGWNNILLQNFFFKLPTLLSDLLITYLLIKTFPGKVKQVFSFYFLSPIIIYACYMHSQLDLIPTALLFLGIYLLKKSSSKLDFAHSFICLGLSLATKTHVVAAFPLIAIYLFRNQKRALVFQFIWLTIFTYLFIAFPYLQSEGFQHLVLHNAKQNQVFDVYAQVGDLRVYLPIFAILTAYGRFILYPKINADLLDAFLTLVFSLFVFLIVPTPGWYVWMVPFLSVFLVKYYRSNKQLVLPFLAFSFFYLLYFIVFHRADHVDLRLLGNPLQLKIYESHIQGMVFTFLEASLLANIILCYRLGVRSNSIYKRDCAVVIGIGGDSGAGKSTLMKDIKNLLQTKIVEVEGDGDHKWSRNDEHWTQFTHLDPKANFLHRQAETIINLKRGHNVKRVNYDHVTGQFNHPEVLHTNDFIVISGLHTFYLPKMRKIIDLKIFMDPDRQIQAHWKMLRDVQERGYAKEQVVGQLRRRQTDADRFIAPQKDFADLVICYFSDTPFDPVDIDAKPSIKLSISLSSSIHLEDIVQALSKERVLVNWDYNEDLTRQDITLSAPVSVGFLDKLSHELVPNLDELTPTQIEWTQGYRGFIQLIVLLILSDLMQEREDANGI